jgi:hypothetical protein
VDAYSRRIIWLNLGNSNRRGVVILKQMIKKIRLYNRCPRFFRSDRGRETLQLADIHYSLFLLYKRSQGLTEEQLACIKPRHCYLFGTSTANIRIESTWQRLIARQTGEWMVFDNILCYIRHPISLIDIFPNLSLTPILHQNLDLKNIDFSLRTCRA